MNVCLYVFMHSYTVGLILLKFSLCLIGSVDDSQFDQVDSTQGGAQTGILRVIM